jgi:predicted transcriptional regulator
MTTHPTSVRLSAETHEKLAKIAKSMDRPKSWLIEQAVEDYVSLQEWQAAAIQKGVESADRGELISHEKMMAWIDSWGTNNELPPPECD